MTTDIVLGDRDTSYLTHREFDAAIALLPSGIRARWIGTDTSEAARTSDADGVWVVSGSPYRDDAAVYAAITTARVSNQPFLGTCAGFQYAVIEFSRNVASITDAEHAETAPDAGHLVIDRLACSLVGQERQVTAIPGTIMGALCGPRAFVGFHWCGYGLAPTYIPQLTKHGLVIAATADDAGVEAVELPTHPFFLATLFQPQIGSIAGQPLHPIIQAFVTAASDRHTFKPTNS